MNPIPDDLPENVKFLLRHAPLAGGKILTMVYDEKGIIRYHTAEGIEGVIGEKINDYLYDPGGQAGVRQEAFFDTSANSVPFTNEINPILAGGPQSGKNELHTYFQGIPATLSLSFIEGVFIAFIHPMNYFMERAKGRLTQDMIVILDDNGEIRTFCDKFGAYVINNPFNGRFMHQLTAPEPWLKLLKREEEAARYLAEVSERPESEWKVIAQFNEIHPERWIKDTGSFWDIRGNTMAARTSPANAFITCLTTFDQIKDDIQIRVLAGLTGYDKAGFMVGVTFHVDIYHANTEVKTPDVDGYNFALRNTGSSARPLFKVVLKRIAQRCAEAIIPLEDILKRKNLSPDAVPLRFERTGGAFAFYIGDEKAAVVYDTRPLMAAHHNYLGLAASNGATLRDIEIWSRPTLLEPHRIPPESVDLQFYAYPGHIYEARIEKLAFGPFREFRCVYLKEVTYSRSLLEKLNAYLHGIEQELDTAKKIETVLANIPLPKNSGVQFAYCHKSSSQVGGDLLDIKELGNDRFAVLIYDVSGHGIAASLVSSMAKMSFENAFKQTQSPAAIMELVNRDICIVADASMFITAFLCIVDLEKGLLTYSRAGHCPPAIFSARRPGAPLLLKEGSPLIGNRPEFEYENHTVSLEAADRVFLYTDGIIELRNNTDELFGKDRLFSTLSRSMEKTVDQVKYQILKEAEDFAKGRAFEDDITFILIDIKKLGRAKTDEGPTGI